MGGLIGVRGLGQNVVISARCAPFPAPSHNSFSFAGLEDQWGGLMGVRGHKTMGTIGRVLRGLGVAGITLSLMPVAHFS